ncbi:MAG TPA: hypothetical protein VLI69_04360 [Gammaproteobacteria bacterium]|nr:hypothetical protein [Gammaproteobacteria bacterium]
MNDSDTAWKEILDAYFKDCLDYCLPELSALINWEKGFVSLDKEFQAISKGTDSGKRILDKLFKVFLKSGREQWVLIHIEIQGTPDEEFAKRMFIYGYRIYDKYQQPVVSCAILTDENKKWRPHRFEVGLAGSYLRSEFLPIKMIDYQNRQDELDASMNPFASVILVQLAALKARVKPHEQRKQVKFALTRRLYEKGFNKKEINNIYKFIDWLIGLPSPFEIEYLEEVCELEEAKKMAYITSAERIGIEKGRKESAEEGKLEVAKLLLREGCEVALVEKTTGISLDQIKALQQKLKKTERLFE